MHMWLSWSAALLDKITSSIMIKTGRLSPLWPRSCCCFKSLSTNGWFHSSKKNRSSHLGWAFIIASRVGQHAAEPTNATTRSKWLNVRHTRFMRATLFPLLLAPTAASTTGSLPLIVSASNFSNILLSNSG